MNFEHLETLRTCDCAIELMTLTRRKAIDYAKHYSGKELRPRLGSTDVRELVRSVARLERRVRDLQEQLEDLREADGVEAR